MVVNDRDEHLAEAVILATGHSARDVYALLHRRGVRLEAKPFALGVRIEHSQSFVDEVQYRQSPRKNTCRQPVTSSSRSRARRIFVLHVSGRFGGARGNLSRRDRSQWYVHVAARFSVCQFRRGGGRRVGRPGRLQQAWRVCRFGIPERSRTGHVCLGDGSQRAPAQRLTDFAEGRLSRDLPAGSYIPGSRPAPLHELLPAFIYQRLQQGVQDFGGEKCAGITPQKPT